VATATTQQPPAPDSAPAGEPAVHRFSVEEYHRLGEAGVLGEDDRVELIEGRLYDMTPIGPLHSALVEELEEAIEAMLPAGWHVRSQQPIALAGSEPQPDLVVVRGAPRDYRTRHAGPADIGLLVEVADTSAGYDRGIKQRVYAAAGIEAYWVLDIDARAIEAYTQPRPAAGPQPAAYARCVVHRVGEAAAVVVEGAARGAIELAVLFP
jgi:Uma2 family endonuclease